MRAFLDCRVASLTSVHFALGRLRWLLAFILSASFAAPATTFSARVLLDGAPVSGAQVNVFVRPQKPLAGCPSSKTDFLGKCLCPSERAAFTTRALAGLEGTRPAASAVTAADGVFSLTIEGEGPFITHVLSADGTRAATLTLGAETKDIALVPAIVTRVRLTGITAGAVAYLINPSTGEITRLEPADGIWVSPPMPPGMSSLVVAAPGAMASRQPMIDGRAMSQPMMGEGTPAVALTAAQTLGGIVTDRGRPVAGVEVVADPETCALTTKTNAAGEFTFPSPIAAPFLTTLIAHAGTQVATAFGSSERTAELALKPAARLEITFVDQKGTPVPGIEAWITGQEGSNRNSPPSDAKGRWTMGDLIDGELQLRLNGTQVLLSESKLSIKGMTKVRAVVAQGVTLKGVVVDSKGKPIAGADLSVFFGEQLQPQVSDAMKDALRSVGGRSDALGAFELKGLLPGEYEVVAKSAAFGEGTAISTAPGRVELKLVAPYFLEGDVVDSAGKPVEKAWLSFHRKGEPNFTYGTSTGPDGHFRYALKAPGVFEVTATGRTRGAPGKMQLAEIPGDAIKFVVADQPLIRGVVVDASGAPQAGVLVQAIPHTMPQLMMARMQRQTAPDPAGLVFQARLMRMYAEATSGPDGSFAIPLGAASVVFAEAGGLASEPVDAKPLTLVRLVLSARSRATGRVLDWNGRPLESFAVNEKHFNSTGGKFDVPLPARGSAQLRIDGALAPYETRTVEVPEAAKEVALGDIKLKRGFSVSGKVIEAATGKPLTRPYLDAKSEGGGQFDSGAVQPDGTFMLKRVPEGKLTLTVTADDYTPAGATVNVKQGTAEVVLKLEKAATLEITVLRKGEPAQGIDVEASGPPIPTYPINKRSHGTASDGRVKLERLSAGSWTVKAGREGGVTRTVKLAPGQQAKLELTIP